jgi:apolipoprotein D and lipocalin family protein
MNTPVRVVENVDLARYTGKWYEIARYPNRFEKGLKCTSAEYSLRKDGRITVLNKGYKTGKKSTWKQATGVAWIPDKTVPAKLKVQFFWPFSGNYWIIFLDQAYRFVLVGDPSHKYLWILSRTKKMDEHDYVLLCETARGNGFDDALLIRVEQDCSEG